MICPHCHKNIPDATVAKHLASKGGKASKRKISFAQQKKMQDARIVKKLKPLIDALDEEERRQDEQQAAMQAARKQKTK